MNLTTLDLVVIGVPLAIVTFTALSLARRVKGVAGFLAADRCAGRYLISTASGELGASVIALLSVLEVFSKAAFSLRFWFSLSESVLFFMGLLGVVVYRFRQTRSLTFHQFFERRYSKGVRVFASSLNVLSGVITFGLQPAVGARFFVYFCAMPETLDVAGWAVPTFLVVMVALMALSLFFTLTGGQVSIMVTDSLEGVISSLMYVAIGGFILVTVSHAQMHEVLLSGTSGTSYVDPFDIADRRDFNYVYVLFGLLLYVYGFRGMASNQGFAAAAKSAHESRMAGVLGSWRGYSSQAMTVLLALAAFTVLHHPQFAPQQRAIETALTQVGSDQLRTQMRMPTALGTLFVPGIKGALCAVLLFGVLASQGASLHAHGSTLVQDVILPLRKKALSPRGHVLALRCSVALLSVIVCVFSYLFKPVDYLVMLTTLIGAIYAGGIGVVVWGGLYWRRGTAAGAWAAMGCGAGLGIGFNLLTQFWTTLAPLLARLTGPGGVADYLAAHAEKFPVNGQTLTVVTAATAVASYVVVSLLSRRPAFDLDGLLHRDQDSSAETTAEPRRGPWYDRLLNINADFTRGDRVLTRFTFFWTLALKIFAVGVLLWVLLVGHPSTGFWFGYAMFTGVWLTVSVGLVVTVWFLIGVTRDLLTLSRSLRAQPSSPDVAPAFDIVPAPSLAETQVPVATVSQRGSVEVV